MDQNRYTFEDVIGKINSYTRNDFLEIVNGYKEINPEDRVYSWEHDSKISVIEGTAVECHNTLRMLDGK